MLTKSPARVETVMPVFVFVTGVTGPRPRVFEICLLFSSHLTCSTELISSLEIFLSCVFPLTPCILIYSQFMSFRYTDRPNVTPVHRRHITFLNCLQSAANYSTRVATIHLFPFCAAHIFLTQRILRVLHASSLRL